MIDWKPMADLSEGHRDGRQLLCTDGVTVRVCVSNRTGKAFEIVHGRAMPGKQRFWMIPTHWDEVNLPGEPAPIIVEGGGFRLLTADPVMIAVVRRCAQLEAAGCMIPVSEALRTDEDAAP